MATTTLEQIEKDLQRLQLEAMRLRAARFREMVAPQIRQSVGKTFSYRNNRSGGEEKWDAFRKLKAVEFSDCHAWLVFEEYQLRTDTGSPEAVISTALVSDHDKNFPSLESGWTPCDRAEFEQAKNLCLSELENPQAVLAKLRER